MSVTAHTRLARVRRRDALSRRASRVVAGVSALICLPVIAVVVLISRTSGPDLFDLVPKVPASDGYALLAWYDLDRGSHSLKEGGISTGALLRALGYMMEGDQPVRDGQIVSRFVLLPDKGNAMHPAHRFGDEMIDVHLGPNDSIRFSGGSLVWVWGALRALPGDTGGPIPLYQLENARVEPADERGILRCFR
jgi:hypothetical protein